MTSKGLTPEASSLAGMVSDSTENSVQVATKSGFISADIFLNGVKHHMPESFIFYYDDRQKEPFFVSGFSNFSDPIDDLKNLTIFFDPLYSTTSASVICSCNSNSGDKDISYQAIVSGSSFEEIKNLSKGISTAEENDRLKFSYFQQLSRFDNRGTTQKENRIKNQFLSGANLPYPDIIDADCRQRTSNDAGMLSYFRDNFSSIYFNGTLGGDDHVVDVIPKSLFFTMGIYSYIGDEWGFIKKTTQDYVHLAEYCTDIFVFDITREYPFNNSVGRGAYSVKPLYQYRYRGIDRNYYQNWESQFYSSLNQVVRIHLQYTSPNYYLRNLQFRSSLENLTALNSWEQGYSMPSDNGYFYTESRYSFSATALRYGDANLPIAEIGHFLIGFIPLIGAVTSSIIFGFEFLQSLQNLTPSSAPLAIQNGNPTLIKDFPNSFSEQLANSGLIKTASARIDDPNGSHLLFGMNDNASFTTRVSNNDVIYRPLTNFIDAFSADLVEDDSYYSLGQMVVNTPTVTSIEKVNFSNGHYIAPDIQDGQTISITQLVNDRTLIRYVPQSSGVKTFYTDGEFDTQLFLYSSGNSLLASNDDDEDNDLVASLVSLSCTVNVPVFILTTCNGPSGQPLTFDVKAKDGSGRW